MPHKKLVYLSARMEDILLTPSAIRLIFLHGPRASRRRDDDDADAYSNVVSIRHGAARPCPAQANLKELAKPPQCLSRGRAKYSSMPAQASVAIFPHRPFDYMHFCCLKIRDIYASLARRHRAGIALRHFPSADLHHVARSGDISFRPFSPCGRISF